MGDGEEFRETEQLISLKVVTQSFDRLQDLLERNTLSPGIKACREVRPMMRHGLFIFQGTGDTNQQLICRVRNVKYSGGATEVPYTDTKFEQLAETRRLLLMTEPPDDDAATLEKREREAEAAELEEGNDP
jgi:hypothetical protein